MARKPRNLIHRSVVDGTYRPKTVEPKTKPKPKTRRQTERREVAEQIKED